MNILDTIFAVAMHPLWLFFVIVLQHVALRWCYARMERFRTDAGRYRYLRGRSTVTPGEFDRFVDSALAEVGAGEMAVEQ
jgi:hypothetical protein